MSMENKNFIIYGLMCPKTDDYRYIGKSKIGTKRAYSHMMHSHNDSVNKWVDDLRNNGLHPIVDIIEYCVDEDSLFERENYWISFYKDVGCDLLNKQLMKNNYDDLFLVKNDEYLFSKNIVESTRFIRKSNKISQSCLANISNVSLGSIKRFENGFSIGIDKVEKICKSLEMQLFVGIKRYKNG